MEAIYIAPKTTKELELLKKIAEIIGADAHIVSEEEKRYFAGLRMVEIAERHPKFDISDEEIRNMAKEVEEEVYGKKGK